MQKLGGLPYAAYRLDLPPASLTEGCQKAAYVLTAAV